MREVKRLIIGVMVLTFLAGVGTGTWIQSLLAASPEKASANLDRRVQDFEQHFELSQTQIRLLKGVLLDYDMKKREIRDRVSAEGLREFGEGPDAAKEQHRENALLNDAGRAPLGDRRCGHAALARA